LHYVRPTDRNVDAHSRFLLLATQTIDSTQRLDQDTIKPTNRMTHEGQPFNKAN
jgi:hypothetical protein